MSTDDKNRGGQQQKLDDVLAQIIRAEEAGEPIDREQLLAQHPHLADDDWNNGGRVSSC